MQVKLSCSLPRVECRWQKKKKTVKNPKVPSTRNANSMTESEYWGKVRSALRKAFAYWKPAQEALKMAECGTRKNPKTGRDRKIYRCAACGEADFPEQMQIDHIEPCGSLKSLWDIAPFLDRLTCEDSSKFQVLHKTCHQEVTSQRKKDGKEVTTSNVVMPWDKRTIELDPIEGHYSHYAAWKDSGLMSAYESFCQVYGRDFCKRWRTQTKSRFTTIRKG